MSRGQYRILIHGLAILAGIFPPLFLMYNMGGESNHMLSRLLISITTIPLYLINIKYLIPFFLQKQKYLIYCIALIGLIVVNGLIFNVISPFNFRQISVTLADGDPISLPSFPIPPVIPFLLMLLIGTTLEMLLAYEQRGKQIEKTQIEKVSAELSFLKSQINPHFFFNTLNSIYALAAIDSYNTQRAILLLSNLMRYLLYESNVDQVLIKKEIQFLKDFIG